ncbi:MAG: Transcriptional regulator, ArsR family [candidate division WWE3 bacterium GW2011_GWF2_41_45]|uniref:HTH arsR-type domain-containing protein n=3 Tax=Katanobacteria TaxID=422282 RepID=A0A1F4W3M4_UNCKA|nr:MAG: Transcriptional regulator, ArsR family [candidate division WWE3 bacterium GW2011_GWC2_41_23]KKS09935.1 MAG: Transcriptional regulator, ArsR family [candidate division WWE3 bacterium GW2011_GWF2_41_45]KKS11912.1 MAG: Transcriptional regulator, ArsR family [candidate division WWE3 bacterium GW2011_GWF1_41_53]KKS19581.1 MAG: Transcriptional regulator, ArsR family [candidate division WWE3 bacterium GW2011_GWE1_41_72]KKS28114.1 MAG: Transcriptional regulator, ArsR family [candidate division 
MKNEIFMAISNPVRLKLIRCLSEKPKKVNDLINICGMSQSAVSQHLAKLKKAGILETHKEGKFVFYKLLYPEAAEIAVRVENLSKEMEK